MAMHKSAFANWVIRTANDWARRHSADPLSPMLTEAVAPRPALQAIMEQFDAIQAEVLGALPQATSIEGELFFPRKITSDGKWDKIYIKWYAPIPAASKERFPTLCRILDQHAEIQLAMVSILQPGGVINPHCGSWCGCIRVHVGISTPNDPSCRFVNGDQTFYWQDGRVEAFDDTYLHHAQNETDKPRIILFLDVERKMNTPAAQRTLRWINGTLGRLTTRQ
ncbi:MAG: aspartyl/asparaginyl beta-hydroxylase domain-containing protein [Rhodospirillaceae bacterium]